MRTGEVGQARAENDNRSNATVEDFLTVAPATVASAFMERFGAKGILGETPVQQPGQIPLEAARAGKREALTEAGQEGLESVAETVGTERGFDPAETAERMAQGAVAGGPFGAGARAVTAGAGMAARDGVPGATAEQSVEDRAAQEPARATPPSEPGPAPQFRTGQNVRINDPGGAMHGATGRVTDIGGPDARGVEIELDGGGQRIIAGRALVQAVEASPGTVAIDQPPIPVARPARAPVQTPPEAASEPPVPRDIQAAPRQAPRANLVPIFDQDAQGNIDETRQIGWFDPETHEQVPLIATAQPVASEPPPVQPAPVEPVPVEPPPPVPVEPAPGETASQPVEPAAPVDAPQIDAQPAPEPFAPEQQPTPPPDTLDRQVVDQAPPPAPPEQKKETAKKPKLSGAEKEFDKLTRIPRRPQTLMDFVRSKGGIKPYSLYGTGGNGEFRLTSPEFVHNDGAEIRAIFDTEAFRFLGHKGLHMDMMREYAAERGFLPIPDAMENSNINDFLRALAKDARAAAEGDDLSRVFADEDVDEVSRYTEAYTRRKQAEDEFKDVDLSRFPSLDMAREYAAMYRDLDLANHAGRPSAVILDDYTPYIDEQIRWHEHNDKILDELSKNDEQAEYEQWAARRYAEEQDDLRRAQEDPYHWAWEEFNPWRVVHKDDSSFYVTRGPSDDKNAQDDPGEWTQVPSPFDDDEPPLGHVRAGGPIESPPEVPSVATGKGQAPEGQRAPSTRPGNTDPGGTGAGGLPRESLSGTQKADREPETETTDQGDRSLIDGVSPRGQTDLVQRAQQQPPPESDRPVLSEGQRVGVGPTSLELSPIDAELHHETNAAKLRNIAEATLTNTSEGSRTSIFVADDPDLAIGQGDNRGGVRVRFRARAVSGRENRKPGTGIVGGREYRADWIAPDAIDEIFLPRGAKLDPLTRRLMAGRFEAAPAPGGRRFLRKGVPPPDDNASTRSANLERDKTPAEQAGVFDSRRAKYQVAPDKPVPGSRAENQRAGEAAMNRVLADEVDVAQAMHRKEIGWIDFIWGDSKSGIRHLIERRESADGIDGRAFARSIPEIIAKGEFGPFYRSKKGRKVSGIKRNVTWNDQSAVIALTRNDDVLSWVLTAFPGHKQRPQAAITLTEEEVRAELERLAADAQGEALGPSTQATQSDPLANETEVSSGQLGATATRDIRPPEDGDKAQAAARPVIRLTGNEFGDRSDLPKLRVKARKHAVDNLFDQTVRNEDTGRDITFNRAGIRKTINRLPFADALVSVVALPELVRSARHVGREPDRKGRKDIRAVHKFDNRLSVGEQDYSVRITVRETHQGDFFYDHMIWEETKVGAFLQGLVLANNEPEGTWDPPTFNENIIPTEDGDKSQAAPRPAIRLTGDELGDRSNLGTLRAAARKHAKVNLFGQTVRNEDTGRDITFDRVGIRKTINWLPFADAVVSVKALPELIRTARHVDRESDHKDRENIRAFHRFSNRLSIDDKDYAVRITVRETHQGDFFYDHMIWEEVEAGAVKQGSYPVLAGRKPSAFHQPPMEDMTPTEAGVKARAAARPVIRLTGDELGDRSDLATLRVKARKHFIENLLGTTVRNEDTDRDISFNRAGFEKTISRQPFADAVVSVVALPDLVRTARHVSREPDRKGREEIRAVHTFSNRLSIGEQDYSVRITVRETHQGNFFYDHMIWKEVEAGAVLTRDPNPGLAGSKAPSGHQPPMEDMTPTSAGVKARAAAERVLKRIAGAAPVEFHARLTGDQGQAAYGRLVDGVIALSLASPDITATARHEAIHFLRQSGRLGGQDWRVLARAAKVEGWVARHDIARRYPGLDDEARLEEAVAETYGEWATGRYEAKNRVLRALKVMQRVFDQVRSAIRRALGREVGWRDLFTEVETGTAARRAARPIEGTEAKYNIPPLPADPHRAKVQPDMAEIAIGIQPSPWYERVQEYMQDRMVRWKTVQSAVEKARGSALDESENVYLQEELYIGRAGEQLDELTRVHLKPIAEAVAGSALNGAQITVPDGAGGVETITGGQILEAYLYARHAPERNARIAGINPDFEEGAGSGMTNGDAAAVLKAIEAAGLSEDARDIAGQVDAMLEESLEVRVAAGLMSPREAAKWRDTYKHYVPLRGIAEEEVDAHVLPRAGSGYNVRGPESKRALGRRSRARDILGHAFVMAQESIIRAEKNRVFHALHNLVTKNPDPELWEVNRVRMAYTLNKTTGQVEYRPVNALSLAEAERTIRGKINAVEVRILIHDPYLARSLQSMGAENFGLVTRFLMPISRLLSSLNTSYNPEFVITNAIRDIQTAGINLQQYDLKGITADTVKNWRKGLVAALDGQELRRLGAASGIGLSRSERGEWEALFKRYGKAGGRVSFWKIGELSDHVAHINTIMADADPSRARALRNGLLGVVDFIEKANVAVDNAVRLAAFKAALDRGMSDAQAASLAKNLTVNFNRKGWAGPAMNALYMFYNAGIQGTAILLQAARSSRVRQVLGGLVFAGFMAEMLNAALSPEDEDGALLYDKIGGSRESADFLKSRNLIVTDPLSLAEDGYWSIPLAYGYNVFWDLGRNMAAYMRGAQSGGRTAGNVLRTTLDMFNPIGTAQNWLVTATPTLIKPGVELYANENFMGGPIYPEASKFETAPEPLSAQPWRNTSTVSREVAKWLNALSGGDAILPGAIDLTPQGIDHVAAFFTGAAGRFWGNLANDAINRATAAVTGQAQPEVELRDVPFARKVYRVKPGYRDRSEVYDAIREVYGADLRLRRYIRSGQGEGARKYRAENRPILALKERARTTRRTLREIRDQRRKLEAGGVRADDPRYRRLDKRESAVVNAFLRTYRAAHAARADRGTALTSTTRRKRLVQDPIREAVGAL